MRISWIGKNFLSDLFHFSIEIIRKPVKRSLIEICRGSIYGPQIREQILQREKSGSTIMHWIWSVNFCWLWFFQWIPLIIIISRMYMIKERVSPFFIRSLDWTICNDNLSGPKLYDELPIRKQMGNYYF